LGDFGLGFDIAPEAGFRVRGLGLVVAARTLLKVEGVVVSVDDLGV